MAVYGMYADIQFFGYFFAEHPLFGKGEYLSFSWSEQGIGGTFDSKRYDLIGKTVFYLKTNRSVCRLFRSDVYDTHCQKIILFECQYTHLVNHSYIFSSF